MNVLAMLSIEKVLVDDIDYTSLITLLPLKMIENECSSDFFFFYNFSDKYFCRFTFLILLIF